MNLGTKVSSYEAPNAARLRDAVLAEGRGGGGGVHLHSIGRILPFQVRALETLARVTLDGAARTLAATLPASQEDDVKPPVFDPGGQAVTEAFAPLERSQDLVCDNGLGTLFPTMVTIRQCSTRSH